MSVCQCNNRHCPVDPGGHSGAICTRRATRDYVIINNLDITKIRQVIQLKFVCQPCKDWWLIAPKSQLGG